MTTGRKLSAPLLGIVAISALLTAAFHGQLHEEHPNDPMTFDCVDVSLRKSPEEFGCWTVARRRVQRFPDGPLFWHLRKFSRRAEADGAKRTADLVVLAEGQVWLMDFGPKNAAGLPGGRVADIGPLRLTPAASYEIMVSVAVMPPGGHSMVHTHPGPEAWYMLAGEQCLDTPAGASSAGAGRTMVVPPDTPMKLFATGSSIRRALVVVIHDATQPWMSPSNWTPPGECGQ